jgi:hypothetical protein
LNVITFVGKFRGFQWKRRLMPSHGPWSLRAVLDMLDVHVLVTGSDCYLL